jgi:DNA repair protein SbcD/Mre11
MRLVHISDTHLGAGGLSRKISTSGINQREEDICDAFIRAIDQIIQIKPDIVIHSGDLFHSVRPTNRIINIAIRQLLRLTSVNIPVVIISGNHDTPKQRGVGSIFSFFEIFPGLSLVYQDKYEKIRIKDSTVHAIPHCLSAGVFQSELEKVEIDKEARFNVLTLHGVVSGIKEFSMGELAELEVPSSLFKKGFDYVALGHYHRYTKVEENVFYAGSTERVSMAELGQEKGFVEVNLSTKEIKFHTVPTRQMIELPQIYAKGKSQADILQEVESLILENEIKDKIVRLKVTQIPVHVYNSLNFRRLSELKAEALYFDLRFEKKEEKEQDFTAKTSIGKLAEEFNQYLRDYVIEDLKKEKLQELGLKYLSEKREEEE